MSTTNPNILVIHCDSMSGTAMRWVGHPAACTPNLDRLAQRGVGFTNNYCNSPQCVPSRASLVSGRYTHSIGAWNNFKGLEPGDPTLFEDARRAGYQLGLIGRNDYRSGSHSLGARVLAWARSAGINLPEKKRPRAIVETEASRRVRNHDWDQVDAAGEFFEEQSNEDAPFFCWLGFCQPHPMGGYTTSPHYLKNIDPDAVTMPTHDPLEHPVCRHSSVAKHTFDPLPEEETLAVRRHYLGMVAEVDAMVGEVLQNLEKAGLADNTVVVFFSDHGDMQLEHRQWLKNSFYEPCARVPLIMAGPGIAATGDCEDLVSLIDLRPTLCEIMDRRPPAECEGRSLGPALSGRPLPPEPVLTQYHSNMMCTGGFMLREGDWKYVAYAVRAEMDSRLRQMVDYEDVDRLAKVEDRQCFRGWRRAVEDEKYREALTGLWRGFEQEHFNHIDRWLEEGEDAVSVD